MRMSLCIALALLPASAGAQSVTCNKVGSMTMCNQINPVAPLDYDALLKSGRDAGTQYMPPPAAIVPDDSLKRNVGKLLAKGDCDAAIQSALKGGDIDLATKARAYCAK